MSRDGLEEEVVMKLQGSYNCRVLQKRGNRKLVKLDSSISPGSVDITIVPITMIQAVEPSRAVVAGGVTMRALLEVMDLLTKEIKPFSFFSPAR